MRAAQILRGKLTATRVPYTPIQKKSELIKPLIDLAPKLNIGITINTIGDTPGAALRRELTNWQAKIV